MKKYYKFGEMILALREEFKEYKHILDELNKCVSIKSDNSNFYFSGLLSDDDKQGLSDRRIRLFVEKKYLDILKKIQYLKYNWYSQFLYSAFLMVERKDNGLYGFIYDDILTPVDDKKYIPKVEIIDQGKFSDLVDELFSSSLMQLKRGHFKNNYDNITLGFDDAYISTPLGADSFISWNGIDDNFKYSITKHNCPDLIEKIFSLEIPADKISPDWLKLLEKHENDFDKELLFDVDINTQSRKGILQVANIENNRVVKLLKKSNKSQLPFQLPKF